MPDMQSQYHNLDKRLSLIELKIQTVEDLKDSIEDVSKVAQDLKTELKTMKAFTKGKNKVIGIWIAVTGILCTGLFMAGQILLDKWML